MDLGLDEKVAFVAGASSGLGNAAALQLAREGVRLAICSRSESRIQTAAGKIQEKAGLSSEDVLPLVCDVRDLEAIETALKRTMNHFGKLNILVTNAGGPPSGSIESFTSSDWRDAIELNLMSTINLCSAARSHLEKAAESEGHARILMVSSVSAKQPLKALPLSNTARAGVQGYAKSLANEVGPIGITVNTLLPGYTKTERLNELAVSIQQEKEIGRSEVESNWADENALKRLGTPEEFGAAVTFLASKPAGYITGVALPVDGGRSKHLL